MNTFAILTGDGEILDPSFTDREDAERELQRLVDRTPEAAASLALLTFDERGHQVGDPRTPAERAYHTEARIFEGVRAIQGGMWALAAYLHEFDREQMWRSRGFDSLKSWSASPELRDLGYRQIRTLIQGYRELVLERDVPVEQLADVAPSKAAVVLPAVARGEVELDEALDDARTMKRAHLREHYRVDREGREIASDMEICPACGQPRPVG